MTLRHKNIISPPSPPLRIPATPDTFWILYHWPQPFKTRNLASFLPTSHGFGFKDTMKGLARIKVKNIHWFPLFPSTMHLIREECPGIVFPITFEFSLHLDSFWKSCFHNHSDDRQRQRRLQIPGLSSLSFLKTAVTFYMFPVGESFSQIH